MHEYDTVLKALVAGSANSFLEQISGMRVSRWLQLELPKVQNLAVDLLGETVDGQLIHIEFQSTNHPQMALRMAEYSLAVFRQHGRFPSQIVLYVGDSKLAMNTLLSAPRFRFEYELVDIRTLDGERLLASDWLSDNVISILADLTNRREAVRRVLKRISELSGEERGVRFQQLSILAGLRRLGEAIREEAQHMPILSDIMDHDLLGPAIQRGMEKGRLEGVSHVVHNLLEKRFGPITAQMEAQLSKLNADELDALAVKVLDAQRAEDLFTRP